MQAGRVIAALIALSAAGCADTASLIPVNPQAQAIGTPRLIFFRGFDGAPSKIVMPDGETLPGSVKIDPNAAPPPSGPGNLTVIARGPRTNLTCHGHLVAGHGAATCQDQNGATYKLDL